MLIGVYCDNAVHLLLAQLDVPTLFVWHGKVSRYTVTSR